MAYCKGCNTIVPEGIDFCEDCDRTLAQNDEQYLDQLLAAVTGNHNEPYQNTNVEHKDGELPDYGYEPISYTEEELRKQNSKDDDWNLLNQTIHKQPVKTVEVLEYSKEIPTEGALDEVESILVDDFGMDLKDINEEPVDDIQDIILSESNFEEEEEQVDYIEHIVTDEMIEQQEDILSIPDELVEEDMQNPLIDQLSLEEDTFLANLLENDAEDSLAHDSELIESGIKEPELIEPELKEPEAIEEEVIMPEIMETEAIEDDIMALESDMDLILTPMEKEVTEFETPNTGVENTVYDTSDANSLLNEELNELNKLLEEVTGNADIYSIDNIMSTGVAKNVEEGKEINTSDILKQSLSAVSDLDDPSLEGQFQSILPDTKPVEEMEKVSFFKRIFANVAPEDPELELKKLAEEEALEEERKIQKAEDKQKKLAEKEEKKAQKVALKESKQKELAEEKIKRQKAKEAIAAAYVPEGKINKAGAIVVFTMAACVGAFIIIGSSLATYHLSVSGAQKDFQNSRFDEAYQALSGEKLKPQDVVVYDKLHTIMIVKKELNSYYNYKKMGMELEALDSMIKGLDRYERYYANAKELEVDAELDSLKKEMLTILNNNYDLGEKDVVKLIHIEDGEKYTEHLTTIVDQVISPANEDGKQIAKKNK